MNKLKLLSIVVILLFVLNLFTLFISLRPGPRHRPPDTREQALEYLMRELQYDQAQRKASQGILQKHRVRMDSIMETMKLERRQLFRQLNGESDTLAYRIGALQMEAEKEALRYFRALRGIAKSSQKAQFDAVIEKAMRRMPPPGRPR
jgi:hypothetical protein